MRVQWYFFLFRTGILLYKAQWKYMSILLFCFIGVVPLKEILRISFIIFAKSDSFQIIQWCCELFCFVFSWACLLWWGVRLNICPPVLPLHTGNRRNQVLSTGKLKNLLILSFSIRFCIYCACFASYSRSIYSVGNMSSLRDLFGFYLKKSRSSNFYCYWRLFTPLFLEVDFTEVTNAWHLLAHLDLISLISYQVSSHLQVRSQTDFTTVCLPTSYL